MAAVLNKRGLDASGTLFKMLESMEQRRIEAYGVATTETLAIKSHLKDLDRLCSPILVGHVYSKTLNSDKPQPMKIHDVMIVLEGRMYSPNTSFLYSDLLRQIPDGETTKFDNLIRGSEGSFAFTIALKQGIIVGRDVMGLYPCYYAEDADLVAVASQRKALWKVGLEKVHSLPPGHLGLITKDGLNLRPSKTVARPAIKKIDSLNGAMELLRLLEKSMKVRLHGLEEVALAFSGGIDSSIVAVLAKALGVDVHLICVSLKGESEAEYTKKAAAALELPIQLAYYCPEDVESILPAVLRLIESSDPIALSIGIPIFWASEVASKMGLRIMLTGQGADELFGGYKRYLDDYMLHGPEFARKALVEDILSMSHVNLERDSKICHYHNVELRLPFVTYELAEFALSLPLKLCIESADDRFRKRVLRNAALKAGLPRFIAERPKRAIQYASGVNKVIKRLARKKGKSLKEFVSTEFCQIFRS